MGPFQKEQKVKPVSDFISRTRTNEWRAHEISNRRMCCDNSRENWVIPFHVVNRMEMLHVDLSTTRTFANAHLTHYLFDACMLQLPPHVQRINGARFRKVPRRSTCRSHNLHHQFLRVEAMLPSKLSIVALVVALAAISLHSVDAGRTFVSSSSISFLRSQERTSLLLRGGASAVLEDQDDVSEIESSDYEEDEEDDLVKSARSTIVKKTKKAVAASLAATKPKKKKTSIVKLLRIPYILGACLNPAIVVQMIKGYWASLFNVNYLKDNTVRDLSKFSFVRLETVLIIWVATFESLNEGSIRKPPQCIAREIKERGR